MYKTIIIVVLLLTYSLLRWEYGFLLFTIILIATMLLAYLRARIEYRIDSRYPDVTSNFMYYLGLFIGFSVVILEFVP